MSLSSHLAGVANKVIKDNATLPAQEQRAAVLAAFGKRFVGLPDRQLPPLFREAVREVDRRMALEQRRERRKERKLASRFGRKYEAYRRIIHVRVEKGFTVDLGKYGGSLYIPGREYQFHATKGRRSYRATE